MLSSPEYSKYAKQLMKEGKPHQSYFTVKGQSVEALIKDRLKRGLYEFAEPLRGDTRVLIDLGKPVGRVYNKKAGKMVQTGVVEVVFSRKDGYHFFPVYNGEE